MLISCNNFSHIYISESILVISSLGIQCTTTFLTGRTKSVFIDFKHVHDIVILEAVSMVSINLLYLDRVEATILF